MFANKVHVHRSEDPLARNETNVSLERTDHNFAFSLQFVIWQVVMFEDLNVDDTTTTNILGHSSEVKLVSGISGDQVHDVIHP